MVISQGDVYWIDMGEPAGSGPAPLHPHVVVQNNVFNRSRIQTIVVCALTSNLKRAVAPGNVLLAPGEANLPKQSVVNISQIFTVSKTDLGGYVGRLSRRRIDQILDGIKLLNEPRNIDPSDAEPVSGGNSIQ
ncbi:MAG: type II toxin-antitoxin system PemK/MazF family toxin [Syntrophobacteraceae bacterium]